MAPIFLSYRRSDGAQACRMHDWLTARFGEDAVFMDVESIPFAVSFPDFLEEAIKGSKVFLALIGPGWADTMPDETDPVRRELEWATRSEVPVLPVLIGTTPMPLPEQLPDTLSHLPSLNALTVDVLQGFHAHMRTLLTKMEEILGRLAVTTVATGTTTVIDAVCEGVVQFLEDKAQDEASVLIGVDSSFVVATPDDQYRSVRTGLSLMPHRTSRTGELLDLHVLLSFWGPTMKDVNSLAGWALHHIERSPVITDKFFPAELMEECEVRIRQSDEDPREIWKMITDQPLQLSQSYVVTVAPRLQRVSEEELAAT